jgi:hypothetical protein
MNIMELENGMTGMGETEHQPAAAAQDSIITHAGENVAEPADPQSTQDPQSSQDPQSTQSAEDKSAAGKPQRDLERDSAFAAMRRRADAQKKENERLKQILEGYQKSPAETGNGAFGKENPESAQRNASLMGISLPEYQAMGGQTQKIAKEHARLKLELEVLRNEKIDRTFDDDLRAVKAAYPEVQAKSIYDLGSKFYSIMKLGDLSAVEAYEVVQKLEEKNKIQPPPSIGSVREGASASGKTFYSSDDVDRLTDRELEDPKILDRVFQSMTKWRR